MTPESLQRGERGSYPRIGSSRRRPVPGLSADDEVLPKFVRRDGVTDGILAAFRAAYGPTVSKEDIFYYVYGILHSPEYKRRFGSDLKKALPRLPITKEAADGMFRPWACLACSSTRRWKSSRGPYGGNPIPIWQGPEGDRGSSRSRRFSTVSSVSEAP